MTTPAAEPLALHAQVALPMPWDSLPGCDVAFGSNDVRLNTGNGHHLFWVTLPTADVHATDDAVPPFEAQVAGPLPTVHTALDWSQLL